MDINQNIKDLDLLYLDAKELVNKIILEIYDTSILKSINDAINSLDEFWRGQDAIHQTNKVIEAKNYIIDNRELLGELGVYISTLIKTIRDNERVNSSNLPPYSKLYYNKIKKQELIDNSSLEVFLDNNITILFNNFDSILTDLEDISKTVSRIKESIITNWNSETEEYKHVIKTIDTFIDDNNKSIKNIENITKGIKTAIDNYDMALTTMSGLPSLDSMFDNNENVKPKLTNEQELVLTNIDIQFKNNKKLNTDFNSKLIEEVTNELKGKGILE